ncbi:MAG: hypothetical protein ACI85O_000264 [Saprospiraceae bacterium]|jgi:hypothetical protein
MPPEKYPHLFVVGRSTASNYGSIGRPIKGKPFPSRNRTTHSQRLIHEYQRIWQDVDADIKVRLTSGLPTKQSAYIAVRGEVNMPFVTKSLENRRSGIRLLNIKEVVNDNGETTTHATIVVPNDKREFFLKKIQEYASKETPGDSPRPKNEDLVTSIAQFELAILSSFWQDKDDLLPSETVESWCELWVRTDQSNAIDSIYEVCELLSIEIKNQQINFPERAVVLIKANSLQLRELIASNPFVAELRKAKETADFWLRLSPSEQADWAIDLKSRLSIGKDASEISVCILDTGINRGHILIEDSLSATDQHQFDLS